MPRLAYAPPSLPLRPTTAPLSPGLQCMLAELDRCRGVPTIADIERCLGTATLDLADVLPHTASDRGAYVRTLIGSTPGFQALVMCWLPGQHSPAHDHGHSACGVRVMQGAATETLYAVDADGVACAQSRRIFYTGDVLCAAGDGVHSLGNLPIAGRERWPVALVTLHVYAPALSGSRKFPVRELPLARVA